MGRGSYTLVDRLVKSDTSCGGQQYRRRLKAYLPDLIAITTNALAVMSAKMPMQDAELNQK